MKATVRPKEGEFLTVKEVAELFRVERSTIYRLIADGYLHAVRVGRQLRVEAKQLLASLR